jgi:hypothetical protein
MFNARIYRAAFVPFLFALGIAAFSLAHRPLPVVSTLAPDAFEGSRAAADLRALAAADPHRRPGSGGDERVAQQVARMLEGLGGTAGGGFSVRSERFSGQTIDGERSLVNVIARRPGSSNAAPIVIIAHRDAAGAGSQAELSGTAVLLELARVFSSRETKRTILLVSTSGGSGGDAGASELADRLTGASTGTPDAVLVLGDLAGTLHRRPYVVPYSDGFGSAPLQLQRTVEDAIAHEAGSDPGAPSVLGQFAHLVFPLAVGEQGVLDAAGLPSVLIQVSGERGPAPRQAVSTVGLERFGRSALSAIDALDVAADMPRQMQTSLLLTRQVLPAWVVTLLVGTLLVPVALTLADGFARLRRRREPVGRWALWTLSCGLPFFTCAVFAYLLGVLGVLGAAPSVPVLSGALPFNGTATTALIAVLLTLALAWLLWGGLVRRLRWGRRPDPEVAGLSLLLVLLGLALVVWLGNPYTALLLLPALHLWLLIASPELRPRAPVALALILAALLPLALIVAFYAHQLGLGAGEIAWMSLLAVAGGHVGLFAAILWSIGLGTLAAVLMLAFAPEPPLLGPPAEEALEVTIRGPLTYAGPGSLGGTTSALRR